MINAREAAAALDGQATSATSLLCPGPGHSRHDRSLSVRFDPAAPDGFTAHSFAGDDWQACRDHVSATLGLGGLRGAPRRAERTERKPGAPSDAMSAWALRLWGEARDAKGTLAERYLTGRSLELDDRARKAIRFHPSCLFGNDRLPCMITLFRDLRSDKPVAIQRTALTPAGEKIGRMMAGPVAGAAVKLDPDDDVTLGLAIAEGVESALAARQLFRPCWALGSAGAIRSFPVLSGLEALTIFADGDPTGQSAAEACLARYKAAGVEVATVTSAVGSDANDAVRVTS